MAATAPAARCVGDTLSVYAWGSNAFRVVAPDWDSDAPVRIPRPIKAFDGVALRDLWMGQTHAAAIDAHGDLLQWGMGFLHPESRGPAPWVSASGPRTAPAPPVRGDTDSFKPRKTLCGKNLRKVAGTEGKLYAVSDAGEVWVVSGSLAALPIPGHRNWTTLGLTRSASAHVEHTRMSAPLRFREWCTDVAVGQDHVLVLTNRGRVLAAPSTAQGNDVGQLGLGTLALADTDVVPSATQGLRDQSSLVPDISAQQHHPSVWASAHSAFDINYCTSLKAIPSLPRIQAIAAGRSHSAALTADGNVFTWGSNELRQCGLPLSESQMVPSSTSNGLGTGSLLERCKNCVPEPNQVDLVSVVGDSKQMYCNRIKAGGDNTFFLVSSIKELTIRGKKILSRVDELYASGQGVLGTLGHGAYPPSSTVPVRVKGVSGRMEFSPLSRAFVAVPISNISLGPDGHASAALVSSDYRVLLFWGTNNVYQLGDGKRMHSALPHYLAPIASLSYLRNPPPDAGKEEEMDSDAPPAAGDMSVLRPTKPVTDPELVKYVYQPPLERYRYRVNQANFQTGTLATPLGQSQEGPSRLHLMGPSRLDTCLPADGYIESKALRRHQVNAEQDLVAGASSSAIFWRIA